jgi:hypothetical protein
VIHDHRPGFPACRYRLKNHAVRVFHALDHPVAISAMSRKRETRLKTGAAAREERIGESSDSATRWWLRLVHRLNRACLRGWYSIRTPERVIDFDEEEFARDPGACLERFDAAGLVYVEDDTYLALPVALHTRRVTSRWPQQFTQFRLADWLKAVGPLVLGRRSA